MHLRMTLLSLLSCHGVDKSPIIVYCDGPQTAKDVPSVEETRYVARELLGVRAEYHYKNTNNGLAASIIAGVTDVVSRYGRAIVIEDDLELAPQFIAYMNQALNYYKKFNEVFQVSAYMFDVAELSERKEALFLPFTVSWGWATWKRAWDHFDPLSGGSDLLRTDKILRRRFNLNDSYDYSSMLEDQLAGHIDSWAIRWYWSVFKAKGVVVFPPKSLVRNRGFDGSGTHGRGLLRKFTQDLEIDFLDIPILPPIPCVISDLYDVVCIEIRRSKLSWAGKIVDLARIFMSSLKLWFRP